MVSAASTAISLGKVSVVQTVFEHHEVPRSAYIDMTVNLSVEKRVHGPQAQMVPVIKLPDNGRVDE